MIDLSRPVIPQKPPRRAWYASTVIAGSLLLHAALVAPLVWSHRAEAAREPEATPVEVVQMPPEPEKPAAKPASKPEPKAAEKPVTKPPPVAKQPVAKPPTPPAPRQAAVRPPKPASRPRTPEPPPPRDKPEEKSVAQRMQQLIGPMPAYALPAMATGADASDDTTSYRQLVLSRVAAQKREGRHDGIPGHVVVAFVIGDGGEVVRSEVREKSDDPKLDAEALAMVARGAPYPPPPPGAPRAFSFGLRFQVL